MSVGGGIRCWGWNSVGPDVAPTEGFTDVAVGSSHSCGLRTDGAIECFGHFWDGAADVPAGRFDAVSAAADQACALRDDGAIDCWGPWSLSYESAPGDVSLLRSGVVPEDPAAAGRPAGGVGERIPAERPDPPPTGRLWSAIGFSAVSAGLDHFCGVHGDGRAACWDGSGNAQGNIPEGLFSDVSAGRSHSCGLSPHGSVQCWGTGGTDSFESDPPSESFVAVAAGDWSSCGLDAAGDITCWGYENRPPAATRFASMSGGSGFWCGLRTDGTLEWLGTGPWG